MKGKDYRQEAQRVSSPVKNELEDSIISLTSSYYAIRAYSTVYITQTKTRDRIFTAISSSLLRSGSSSLKTAEARWKQLSQQHFHTL